MFTKTGKYLNLSLLCKCCRCTASQHRAETQMPQVRGCKGSISSLSFRSLLSSENCGSVRTGWQKMFVQRQYFTLMMQWQLKQQDWALIATATRGATSQWGSSDVRYHVCYLTQQSWLRIITDLHVSAEENVKKLVWCCIQIEQMASESSTAAETV